MSLFTIEPLRSLDVLRHCGQRYDWWKRSQYAVLERASKLDSPQILSLSSLSILFLNQQQSVRIAFNITRIWSDEQTVPK